MTFLGQGGEVKGTFKRLTVSWMDPHTTRKEARGCPQCHSDPRALGLGRGAVALTESGWTFEPAMSKRPESLGIEHPLDAFVAVDGSPLVNFSRTGSLRTFDKEEIDRILTVGICISCHSNFSYPKLRPISSKGLTAVPCSTLMQVIPQKTP